MHQGGWIEDQADLQNAVGNAVPLEGAALSDYLRWNALALMVEVGEALAHASWKPWTTDDPWIERAKFLEELADVGLFLGNMLAAVGCSTEEFEMLVGEKQQVVRTRLTSQRYKQRRVSQ